MAAARGTGWVPSPRCNVRLDSVAATDDSHEGAVQGVTIRIFLADGRPAGLRVLEKSNWTGRGLDFARAEWPTVRARAEFGRPGVYLLTGPADDGGMLVYVGEADELRKRLDQHHAGKDFWTRAIAFTSKDVALNKAHVRYLEARLIGLARAAKRVSLDNGTSPPVPALGESDQAEVEAFLEDMLLIYPLVGVDAFVPPAVSTLGPSLRLSGRGVEAFGDDGPDGFIVRAGSFAAASEVPSIHAYLTAQRDRLIAAGLLLADGGRLRFVEDRTFNSPSTAAGVVLGRTANGRIEWKNDAGKTLKELQTATTGAR